MFLVPLVFRVRVVVIGRASRGGAGGASGRLEGWVGAGLGWVRSRAGWCCGWPLFVFGSLGVARAGCDDWPRFAWRVDGRERSLVGLARCGVGWGGVLIV